MCRSRKAELVTKTPIPVKLAIEGKENCTLKQLPRLRYTAVVAGDTVDGANAAVGVQANPMVALVK